MTSATSSAGTSAASPTRGRSKPPPRSSSCLSPRTKRYLVVNCPPGSGKSTLFAHDIPAWLTVRNRQIRGMIGSAMTTPPGRGYIDTPPADRLAQNPPGAEPRGRDRLRPGPRRRGDPGPGLRAVPTVGERRSGTCAARSVVEQTEGEWDNPGEGATWWAAWPRRGYIGQRFNFCHLGRPGGFKEAADHRGAKRPRSSTGTTCPNRASNPRGCSCCRVRGSRPTICTATASTR